MTEPEKPKPRREKDKSDLVNDVMARFGTPSYEAWDMTVEQLTEKLKES